MEISTLLTLPLAIYFIVYLETITASSGKGNDRLGWSPKGLINTLFVWLQ